MLEPSSRNRSGETACTLILIGLILQGIEVVILLLIGLVFLIVPFLGAVVLGIAVIGIIWLVLVYSFSYQRAVEGDYGDARTPTLVFGILSLLTFGLISGILYIIAYVKLGDAEPTWSQPAQGWGAPPAPAWGAPPAPAWGTAPIPSGSKFCPACGRQSPMSSRFCPGCGGPLP